jgi:hypothetical protein
MPGPGVIVTERGVERRGGLPAEMSLLVGRGTQIFAVLDGLRAYRVVTLTGPGGCGKTRSPCGRLLWPPPTSRTARGWSSRPPSPIPRSFAGPSYPFVLALAYAGRREGAMVAPGDRGGPWPGCWWYGPVRAASGGMTG